MPTKPTAPAVPADKPPRKAVDKLPTGSVRVGLDTVVLTDEQAEALAFNRLSRVPEDRREIASAARESLQIISKKATDDAVATAVEILRRANEAAALAEAERAEQEAIAKANALRSKLQQGSQVSALAEQPAGEVQRKSAS